MPLAAAAVLAGAAVQSATGFGFALVASPALFAVLDPYEAVSALLALGAALNVLVLLDGGTGPVRWRALAPLLAAAVPGLVVGVLALEALSKPALQLCVGVAVVTATLVQLRLSREEAHLHASAPPARTRAASAASDPGPAALTGLVSGALTTSISISGPPIVLWLDARRAPPTEFRATLAAAFLALNFAGWVALLAGGGVGELAGVGVLLPLLALVLAGHFAGALLFRRLDSGSFRFAVLGLVMAAGVASTVAGIAELGG
jgi:uncharacterized membrane protein YfcA